MIILLPIKFKVDNIFSGGKNKVMINSLLFPVHQYMTRMYDSHRLSIAKSNMHFLIKTKLGNFSFSEIREFHFALTLKCFIKIEKRKILLWLSGKTIWKSKRSFYDENKLKKSEISLRKMKEEMQLQSTSTIISIKFLFFFSFFRNKLFLLRDTN